MTAKAKKSSIRKTKSSPSIRIQSQKQSSRAAGILPTLHFSPDRRKHEDGLTFTLRPWRVSDIHACFEHHQDLDIVFWFDYPRPFTMKHAIKEVTEFIKLDRRLSGTSHAIKWPSELDSHGRPWEAGRENKKLSSGSQLASDGSDSDSGSDSDDSEEGDDDDDDDDNHHVAFEFALSADDKLIGAVSLIRPDRTFVILEYWLASSWRGQGIIAAAIRAALDWAFKEMDGLVRVEAFIGARNEGSRTTARKLGMVREGVMKKVHRLSKDFIDDLEVWAIVKDDGDDEGSGKKTGRSESGDPGEKSGRLK